MFLERLKTSSEAPFNFVSLRESYHNLKIMSQEDQDKINVPEPLTFFVDLTLHKTLRYQFQSFHLPGKSEVSSYFPFVYFMLPNVLRKVR